MSNLPIACELSPEDLSLRRESLLADLLRRSANVEPLESGYRLVFGGDSETLRIVTTAVEAERKCCRFLRFVLRFEPDLGPVVLEISGPPGSRELLTSVLFPTV